ncbi:hypothetical protein [Streptomyces sp. NPDC053427]|uniref:hypothetical protein n=1 Tax=Streptomyces sp. NPDC053427 TaxID=3365701 RepID=UPI0037D26641
MTLYDSDHQVVLPPHTVRLSMKGAIPMHSDRSRRPNSVGCLVIGAMAITFVALFAVMLSGGDDDSLPRCPVSRYGTVDTVVDEQGPCVLYGAEHGATTSSGTHHQGDGHSAATKKPGGSTKGKLPTGKQPGAKAPAARPKVPAAPAPRPPSMAKR